MINQTSLVVSDLVLVRTTIQVLLCSLLVSSRAESILPSTFTKRFYTIMQGKVFCLLDHHASITVKSK